MQERNALNLKNKIVILVFVIFIAFFGISYIMIPEREFSEMENRYLTTFPEFSRENFLSGDYTADFEAYTADQIVGKDVFVKGHVAYSRALGISEINQVYFGKEGYLIQDYQEPGAVLSDNLNYILAFAREHPNVELTFLIAPNVNEIYPEYLPDFATTYPQSQVIDTMEHALAPVLKDADEAGMASTDLTLTDADKVSGNEEAGKSSETVRNLTIVDVTDTLIEHKSDYIFYKTDHHWTTLGAYYAYEELCDALEIQAKSMDCYEIQSIEEPFYGTLYSKAPAFRQESDTVSLFVNPEGVYQVNYVNENKSADSMYNMDYAQQKDKYSIFFGGNYALTVIQSNSENQEKVLIIKDSYANSVIPFLADNYSEIHMMDLRYYHNDVSAYIEEHDITKVIFIQNVDFLSTENCFLWL